VLGEVPHLTDAVAIDGVLDEPLWSRALKLELDIETEPRENLPASTETFVYVAETGSHLLIAFDARDPDPELIRAYLPGRMTSSASNWTPLTTRFAAFSSFRMRSACK
jgi:hypothetical protein